MTIQEAKDFFLKSDFSDIAKSKILAVLATVEEMTPEVFAEIKTIMQAELDNDFTLAGVDITTDTDAQALKKEYDATLEQIETELHEDIDFVEKELSDIEDMRKQVMQTSDEMDADKIRQSLQG